MTIAMKRRRRTSIGDILLFILMVFIALIMVVPFFWMLITSFKENGQVLIFPPQWIPNPWRWDNYSYAWSAAKMGLYFRNSAIVTVLITIGQTVTCSLAAFAFSRLEFKGRDTIFLIYLGTMMIPIQVTLIPLYIIMKNFGWNDSFQGLIVPYPQSRCRGRIFTGP
jgi:multiple sugar transport system permease protein